MGTPVERARLQPFAQANEAEGEAEQKKREDEIGEIHEARAPGLGT
jgi:hypothetical protein